MLISENKKNSNHYITVQNVYYNKLRICQLSKIFWCHGGYDR